ncbi:MAG: hypothetical protein ABI947_06355 [Chloroflexota bacterium]
MSNIIIAFLGLITLMNLLLWVVERLLGIHRSWFLTLMASFFGLVVAGNVTYVIAMRNLGERDFTWLFIVLATIITVGILVFLEFTSRLHR